MHAANVYLYTFAAPFFRQGEKTSLFPLAAPLCAIKGPNHKTNPPAISSSYTVNDQGSEAGFIHPFGENAVTHTQ